MIALIKPASSQVCLHFMLNALSPFQSLVDKPGFTHEFCNKQALLILKNDGCLSYADLLLSYLTELNQGVYWADKDWKNVHHYFEPCSRKGLWNISHAVDTYDTYYRLALTAARQFNVKKAMFFLGAAAHLLQDLCVPHHARNKLFDGHKQYELWAQRHSKDYAVSSQGIYYAAQPAHSLILNNACIAADLFNWVRHEDDHMLYHKATTVLLPLAQRATAGLFRAFVDEALLLTSLFQTANLAPLLA